MRDGAGGAQGHSANGTGQRAVGRRGGGRGGGEEVRGTGIYPCRVTGVGVLPLGGGCGQTGGHRLQGFPPRNTRAGRPRDRGRGRAPAGGPSWRRGSKIQKRARHTRAHRPWELGCCSFRHRPPDQGGGGALPPHLHPPPLQTGQTQSPPHERSSRERSGPPRAANSTAARSPPPLNFACGRSPPHPPIPPLSGGTRRSGGGRWGTCSE